MELVRTRHPLNAGLFTGVVITIAVSHFALDWLIIENFTVIACSSIIQLQEYENTDPAVIQQQEIFVHHVLERKRFSSEYEELFIVVEGDSDFADLTTGEEAEVYDLLEMDDFTPDTFDEYLSAQVLLPVGDTMHCGELIHHRRDHNGKLVGLQNANPMLDTRKYEVLFPDGTWQLIWLMQLPRTCIHKLILRAIPLQCYKILLVMSVITWLFLPVICQMRNLVLPQKD
jgi:hypothetical protein